MISFCLIRLKRLDEALKIVSEAEKLIFLQVKYCLEDFSPPIIIDYINKLYDINDLYFDRHDNLNRSYDITTIQLKQIHSESHRKGCSENS